MDTVILSAKILRCAVLGSKVGQGLCDLALRGRTAATDLKQSERRSSLRSNFALAAPAKVGAVEATFCAVNPTLRRIQNRSRSTPSPRCRAGGVATILAALLRDDPIEGLGPVRCVALGPAAVLSAELAEAAAPFTVSVVLGCARVGLP